MIDLLLRGKPRMMGIFAAGLLSLMASFGASTAMAADAPAAIAAKLSEGSKLSRLWADDSLRLPVIIEFAKPAVPDAASFASPAEADAAQTSAVHSAQSAILSAAFGSDFASVASADSGLKRMDFSPMFGIKVTAAELAKLAAVPQVVAIHEDKQSKPLLDTALPVIGMPAAYALGATGAGYTVAVLDTGARRSHEFLNAQIVSAACYSTTDAGSSTTSYCPGGVPSSTDINSANDCPLSITGCSHGTHVSGIAAGFNANRQAGEPANGAARAGKLISINVFSRVAQAACGAGATQDCTITFGSDQILGLERVFALRNTFKIAAANMSLGSDEGFAAACDNDPLKPIIDQLRAANIATVIAAGNEFRNAAVGSPACISTAIAVASSTRDDARSDFSNWGTLIDVVAPGSDIISSYQPTDTSYLANSGTSMASPMVAGVFAAIRTVRPNATVSQIEAALKSTGVGILSAGVTKPRINVPAAINAIPAGGGTTTIVTAITPVARVGQVGNAVTTFATIINAGASTATQCRITKPAGGQPFTLDFYFRNLPGNTLGAKNAAVNIAPGASANFLLTFTPTGAMQANLLPDFDCSNTPVASKTLGLNSFLLVGTATPSPDVLSTAVAVGGTLSVPLNGTAAVAMASVNIGATATLTARLSTVPIGGATAALPLTMLLCRTNPTTGACITAQTATPISFTATPNQAITFSGFVTGTGQAIAFDPANKRVFIHFFQGTTPVGSASVAVRTIANPDPSIAAAN